MTMTPRERGQKIATLRPARGWSKRHLARAADLSPQHVLNIEAGSDPSITILLQGGEGPPRPTGAVAGMKAPRRSRRQRVRQDRADAAQAADTPARSAAVKGRQGRRSRRSRPRTATAKSVAA
jgi:DNA-binding XRE family transcriptional regulator